MSWRCEALPSPLSPQQGLRPSACPDLRESEKPGQLFLMSLPSSASTRRGRLSRTWASATETGLQGRGPAVTRRCSPRVACGLGRHTLPPFMVPSSGSWPCSLHCCCLVAKCVPLFATPWTQARQASRSFTISRSLLKLLSIESVMPSNRLILSSSHPFSHLQSFPASRSFPMCQFFTSAAKVLGFQYQSFQ